MFPVPQTRAAGTIPVSSSLRGMRQSPFPAFITQSSGMPPVCSFGLELGKSPSVKLPNQSVTPKSEIKFAVSPKPCSVTRDQINGE